MKRHENLVIEIIFNYSLGQSETGSQINQNARNTIIFYTDLFWDTNTW